MNTPNDFNPTETSIRLSPDDARLLDALAEAGFDRQRMEAPAPADARRLDAIDNLMGLLNEYPVEDAPDTLVHATMARIDRHEAEQTARMRFDTASERVRGGWFAGRIRIPDFITVAAIVLIAVSVMWPIFSNMRNKSIDMACADNMRRLGYAFSQYSNDNNGAVPMAMAGPTGTWENVRNVLNLKPLVDTGYCKHDDLTCPGHHHEDPLETGPSYNYRWFKRGAPIGWANSRVTVVLGDMNPLVGAALQGDFLPPLSMSPNHAGRGQNILVSDGSTLWLVQPVIGRNDNIWLPNGVMQLHPGEMPVDDWDVFLLP